MSQAMTNDSTGGNSAVVTATVYDKAVYVPARERPKWLKTDESYDISLITGDGQALQIRRTLTEAGLFKTAVWFQKTNLGDYDEMDIEIRETENGGISL